MHHALVTRGKRDWTNMKIFGTFLLRAAYPTVWRYERLSEINKLNDCSSFTRNCWRQFVQPLFFLSPFEEGKIALLRNTRFSTLLFFSQLYENV